mgnify:CR=1 FL=1|tara:strand:- start:14712 stop:14837 length:126 start_codon:yes stop_codon:yes gene_type:complete
MLGFGKPREKVVHENEKNGNNFRKILAFNILRWIIKGLREG